MSSAGDSLLSKIEKRCARQKKALVKCQEKGGKNCDLNEVCGMHACAHPPLKETHARITEGRYLSSGVDKQIYRLMPGHSLALPPAIRVVLQYLIYIVAQRSKVAKGPPYGRELHSEWRLWHDNSIGCGG